MYFTSPGSNITPAMVSVAMSRTDSRDSTCSTTSNTSVVTGFSFAPQHVSYSPLPMSISRTTSNASSASSTSLRRASQISSRRESASWMPSPYRSCQQSCEEPSSFLSDDDLLWIAPQKSKELPITTIPKLDTQRRRELTTEEQIAILREQQERERESELIRQQQQRRHSAAAAAQKAVRFAPQVQRRGSALKKKATAVRKGLGHN